MCDDETLLIRTSAVDTGLDGRREELREHVDDVRQRNVQAHLRGAAAQLVEVARRGPLRENGTFWSTFPMFVPSLSW